MASLKQKWGGSIAIAGASLLAFISPWEGRSLPVYADKLANDLPTVCNGHTGPDVKLGDVWTKEQCDAILVTDVTKHGEGVLACTSVALNQNEYDAYASLAFNNGVGAYCNSSIPGKLARGDRAAACRTILEFNQVRDYSHPKVWSTKRQRFEYPLIPSRGLTRRRTAEYNLCVKPMPVPSTEKSLA